MENNIGIITGITELWWNSLCGLCSSIGDGRSFRKDRLASPKFAVNRIGRTGREVLIYGSIVCKSNKIVVTEIRRGVRRGSSFSGSGLEDSTFLLR